MYPRVTGIWSSPQLSQCTALPCCTAAHTRPVPNVALSPGEAGAGPQTVRLQCPHLALAAPAPQLSSPSVQSANVRRSLSSRSVQQFIPRPCVRSLHSLPGLYRVMRASRSKVTPFPWCCGSWPRSATLGRALLGPQVEKAGAGGAIAVGDHPSPPLPKKQSALGAGNRQKRHHMRSMRHTGLQEAHWDLMSAKLKQWRRQAPA